MLGYKLDNIGSQNNNQRKLHTLQDISHSVGYMDEDRVAVIEEEDEGIPDLVCRCSPNTTFNNWKAIEISEMISISK